jgi:hypothetical protein
LILLKRFKRLKELEILMLRLLILLDERTVSGVDFLIVEMVLSQRGGGSDSGKFPMRSDLVHGNKCTVL